MNIETLRILKLLPFSVYLSLATSKKLLVEFQDVTPTIKYDVELRFSILHYMYKTWIEGIGL